MRASRRQFFSFFGLTAALAVTPTKVDDGAAEMQQLQKAIDDLNATLAKPVQIKIVFDGKKIADAAIKELPATIQRRGMA